ncbi:protein TPR3-like isoform X3 [Olea europaea var. sylvestris]|uniref:protein TPR3-like isoform X3 n=1 Tax=Olea europaea var. sylvestris TaxID=158386 RepID=UPI000C1D7C55|nr:protein TPR3-like isoform X3 [Olea europaea var. sylvestris]
MERTLYSVQSFPFPVKRKESVTTAMSLSKDLIFLILQFCNEENLKRTAHMLEQETGYFFDMKYFEDLVLNGNWEESEKYLLSFTGVEDNKYSTKIYFEIRKQKFLEALDKHDHAVALDILRKDLKVFAQSNKELYKEITQLLTLDDFREHGSLSSYGDTMSARKQMMNELTIVIEANPLLRGRTKFPQINKSRLRRLINQSLNWQHLHCTHPHPQPHIDTLFTDHKCPGPDHLHLQDQLNEGNPSPSTPMPESILPVSAKPTCNSSTVTESAISDGTMNLRNLTNQAESLDGNTDFGDTSKIRSTVTLNEVVSPIKETPYDVPATVERVLDMGSSPSSIDFHPVQQTLLLVGNNTGGIELWNVTSAKKLFTRQFMVWEVKTISAMFLEDMVNNPHISVNRILWSPDGLLFGIAYSKNLVQLYSYHYSENYTEKHLEIDAHDGSVNDLAFAKPYNKLVAISCGDDKLIQVWDTVTGAKQFTFEGHGAPVYSLCPHENENIHFVFSISTSGQMKAWLFDNMGSRITYAAPGLCPTRMSYSTDGKRLFSCGTNKDGGSYLVEWNQSEGFVMRNYRGLCQLASGQVQFDTSNNKFLAAGDEHVIKVWDMDNADILAVIDADGGLPASPYICFNKEGTLLAVFSDHNRIKILANHRGHQLLQTFTFVSSDSSEFLSKSSKKLAVDSIPLPAKTRIAQGDVPVASGPQRDKAPGNLENEKSVEQGNKLEMQNISKIVEVSRCRSLQLTSKVETKKIRRLLYTHAGNGILALAEDGIHLLWRWSKNDSNLSGKATTKCVPQLWQPKSGLLMINDLPESNIDLVSPCFCLSKNDSYVVSASGKMVSLFNMLIFKRMRSFMQSPPAATCIVFYPPDNNIIAIGMDDSTILIYNVRVDELTNKLKGHSKRISSLSFSTVLNVLVSSGLDAQIVVWDSITWEKKNNTFLEISSGWLPSELSETHVQFDKDERHFLAVHETQLAIYETTKLQCVKQWVVGNFCARIAHAAFSCDAELLYTVMRDGIVLILGASDLVPRFEIDPSAYLPQHIRTRVYPLVVAAHPQKANQFALGLSDGGVVIIEPMESESTWTAPLQIEN